MDALWYVVVIKTPKTEYIIKLKRNEEYCPGDIMSKEFLPTLVILYPYKIDWMREKLEEKGYNLWWMEIKKENIVIDCEIRERKI
jgi:hypothetical protein